MQGILGRQIEANRQALERDAMNMRGGVLRQDPSLMQRIGGVLADYAVPDRYERLLNSSVMEPRLNMEQLESLRGTPVNMADVPNPVPMLMDTMPMAGITVFHGSPHKFDKFDMSKIGTGEGAQAYGHGLYFAENPNVAREYSQMSPVATPSPNRTFKGVQLEAGTPEYHAGTLLEQSGMTIPKAKREVQGWIDEHIAKGRPTSDKTFIGWQKTLATLEKARSKKDFATMPNQHLYKVDIPDEHIDKMLDWDKPLSEQPKSVMDAVDKILPKSKRDSLAMRGLLERDDYTRFHTGKTIAKPLGELTGKEIQVGLRSEIRSAFGSDAQNYREALGDADKFLKAVAGREKNSDSLTSAVLKREGIKGIKYLDQGSRGAGKGTHNFVVFDDQIPQILEINDKPLKGVLSGQ